MDLSKKKKIVTVMESASIAIDLFWNNEPTENASSQACIATYSRKPLDKD